MWFSVSAADGRLLYEGYSWPMARAALDSILLRDIGCPALVITPIEKE